MTDVWIVRKVQHNSPSIQSGDMVWNINPTTRIKQLEGVLHWIDNEWDGENGALLLLKVWAVLYPEGKTFVGESGKTWRVVDE